MACPPSRRLDAAPGRAQGCGRFVTGGGLIFGDGNTADPSAATRINRDYRAGELSPANYERLSADIAAELEAAEAESRRLREHAEQVRGAANGIDAEAETLRALAELRAQICEQVNDRGVAGIEALRAAVASLFESVEVIPDPPGFVLGTPPARS